MSGSGARTRTRLVRPDTPPDVRLDLLRRRRVTLVVVPHNSSWRPTDWGVPGIALVATGPTGQLLYRVTLSA